MKRPAGLPEGTIEAARSEAKEEKKRRLDFHLRSSKLRSVYDLC
jgi:hypothetical protein